MTEHILIMTSVPDAGMATKLARHLVESRLAACVNVLAPMHSVYRWQGKVEEADEIQLMIKTTKALYATVEEAILELHPYDVPEVISMPIMDGLPSYLSWLSMETDS